MRPLSAPDRIRQLPIPSIGRVACDRLAVLVQHVCIAGQAKLAHLIGRRVADACGALRALCLLQKHLHELRLDGQFFAVLADRDEFRLACRHPRSKLLFGFGIGQQVAETIGEGDFHAAQLTQGDGLVLRGSSTFTGMLNVIPSVGCVIHNA